jgi:hypothetical protein
MGFEQQQQQQQQKVDPKLVFEQTAAPVPEIMDSYLYYSLLSEKNKTQHTFILSFLKQYISLFLKVIQFSIWKFHKIKYFSSILY